MRVLFAAMLSLAFFASVIRAEGLSKVFYDSLEVGVSEPTATHYVDVDKASIGETVEEKAEAVRRFFMVKSNLGFGSTILLRGAEGKFCTAGPPAACATEHQWDAHRFVVMDAYDGYVALAPATCNVTARVGFKKNSTQESADEMGPCTRGDGSRSSCIPLQYIHIVPITHLSARPDIFVACADDIPKRGLLQVEMVDDSTTIAIKYEKKYCIGANKFTCSSDVITPKEHFTFVCLANCPTKYLRPIEPSS